MIVLFVSIKIKILMFKLQKTLLEIPNILLKFKFPVNHRVLIFSLLNFGGKHIPEFVKKFNFSTKISMLKLKKKKFREIPKILANFKFPVIH